MQSIARLNAASLYLDIAPRGTKLAGVSSQRLSDGRETGGAVGQVAVEMIAMPEHALRIAKHLLAVARGLAAAEYRCMIDVLCAEQRPDSAEDIAQTDLLADPDNPAAMREYLRQNEAAQAGLQEAHDVVARRLREKEAGR